MRVCRGPRVHLRVIRSAAAGWAVSTNRTSSGFFWAIALLAGAVTLLEITLTRIFSFIIWHHFAFMVISVALLGFAVSGVLLQVRPAIACPVDRRAAWSASLFAFSVVAAVMIVTRIPFDSTRIGFEPRQLFYLAAYYVVLLVPFTLAGLAIVSILNGFSGAVGRLYAADLCGAGLGCVVAVGTIERLGAEGLIVLTATLAAAGAALLRLTDRSLTSRRKAAWVFMVVAFASCLPAAGWLLPMHAGAGKGLAELMDTKLFPQTRLVLSRWSSLARIDVVEHSSSVRYTSNKKRNARSPEQKLIVIDGDAETPLIRDTRVVADDRYLDYMLPSVASQIFHPARVLVVGAGGGVDVRSALHHGAVHVDAVEINPITVGLVTDTYAEWLGGLFSRQEVSLHLAEGRSFVRRVAEPYDMIQLSLVDTWAAAASGAYSLAEGYLYTVEAFEDYLEDLTENGVLTLTRWRWVPARETLKLCTVATEALRRRGVLRPEQHIVLMANTELATILVKRTPFRDAELRAVRTVAEAADVAVLVAPGLRIDDDHSRFFSAPDRAAFIDAYPYDIRPATDDSPFFFQFGWWRDAQLLGVGWREASVLLSGRLVLLATAVQAAVASSVLLVLPLFAGATKASGAPRMRTGRVVAYFFLIGLSFMLLEIALMQRLTLYLGHPVYAIVAVLSMLLASAGVGSSCTTRLLAVGRLPAVLFPAIGVVVVVYAVGLQGLFQTTLPLALSLRFAVTAALLCPLGFLIGVPFPAAIASLVKADQEYVIGWAWASNGCASVLGPILAVLLAMDVGFRAVMIVAALGYLAAGLVFGTWTPVRQASTGERDNLAPEGARRPS